MRARSAGASVRMVVGIDLDGTSKEALEEILSWGIDARVVKNRNPRHTFHPKLYLVERSSRADLLLGSNNLTDGGCFTNYEATVHTTFELPEDQLAFQHMTDSLKQFLDPSGPTAQPLTEELIKTLLDRGDILLEKVARSLRKSRSSRLKSPGFSRKSPFGTEPIHDPPPLSRDLLDELVPIVSRERKRKLRMAKKGKKLAVSPPVEITPTAYYMTLNKLQGKTIPGEARIPIEARDLAEEFWGWPSEYKLTYESRGKKKRAYWNWKPIWLISDASAHGTLHQDKVRMYEYVDSADFRFYSSRLVELGADEGDIVRIARSEDTPGVFECVLAKKGTSTHSVWSSYCTRPIRNSTRRYGYA